MLLLHVGIYGDRVKQGSRTESLLLVLKTKLDVELRVQRDLLELQGLVETIASMSAARKPALLANQTS